ncbi:MAG TPA: efflux RND transporter periplasmic adaptor subunit [Verrucomicrobiae bacterium]|nr:efflux RND transporter periplasmic adaptor subunit [Verrucomicrobiae bacterium]
MKWFKRSSFWLMLIAAGCSRAPKQAPPAAPEVAVVTVAQQPVVLTTELPGRTAPFVIADIRPQVNGLIQKRLFTEGSDVQVGQALYQIDPAPFQAAFDKAQANFTALRLKSERVKDALASKAVSQQDVDDAEAGVKQAQAELDMARINLGYTKIVAPISGRIGKSTVTDGAIVTAYQPTPLATIQQLDPIYVDVPQSTSDLLRLQRRLAEGRLSQEGNNQKAVQLILEDGTKYPSEGTLQFRDISVDPSTATMTLRMVFPNPNGVLLPGMFVRAAVKEGVNEQAILIPQQAVMRDPKGNPMALIVKADGTAEQRMLTLDRAVGDKWLVTSGLTNGEQVIVEGLMKARAGMAVKPVPFEGAH